MITGHDDVLSVLPCLQSLQSGERHFGLLLSEQIHLRAQESDLLRHNRNVFRNLRSRNLDVRRNLLQGRDRQVGNLPVNVNEVLESAFCGDDRVGHQQRHRHRADAARHGRDEAGAGRGFFKVDVAHQTISCWLICLDGILELFVVHVSNCFYPPEFFEMEFGWIFGNFKTNAEFERKAWLIFYILMSTIKTNIN